MLLVKKGYPEEDDFVFCTVTDVQFHSVFVKLDEYENKSGMIHISEIASGRIRNTREYVKEGKKIVCKVLRINQEKGHIDLSLRRVNESQKRVKLNDIKQEQAAEKILEFVAIQQKLDRKTLFEKVYASVVKKYPSLYSCFEEVASGKISLEKLFIDPAVATSLSQVILQRVKPLEVHIKGELQLLTYDPQGVSLIHQIITKAKATQVAVKYKGAGVYLLDATGDDFKKTEQLLKKSADAALVFAKQKKVMAAFKRQET